MPRKKIKLTGEHTLFVPSGALSTIDKFVDDNSSYKEKVVWKCKYLLALSSLVERCAESDKKFVPVSIRVQSDILRCNHVNCVKIYKNLLQSNLIEQSTKNYKTAEHSYEYKPVYDSLQQVTISREYLSKPVANMFHKAENPEFNEKLSGDLKLYLECVRKIGFSKEVYEEIERHIENTIQNTENKSNNIYSTLGGITVPTQQTKFDSVVFLYPAQDGFNYKTNDLPISLATLYLTPDLINVFRILEGKFKVYRPDKESRIYSNITNLNKRFRPYLRLDGKPLIGLDIANSQPLLAAIIFREYSKKKYNHIKDDVLEYQSVCEQGQFYEYFMQLNGISKEKRGEFKKQFFGKVFFTKEVEKPNELKTQFRKKFPTCYEAIFNLKGGMYSKEYKGFPIGMQQLEASIIVDVNMELIKSGHDAINIFDSIYVTTDDAYARAQELLLEHFNNFGITPKFNKEDYRNTATVSISDDYQDQTKEEYILSLKEKRTQNKA